MWVGWTTRGLIMFSLCYFRGRTTRQQGMDIITMDQGSFHHSIKCCFFFGVLEDLLCVLYVILGEESPSNKEWTLSLWIKGVFIIPSSIFSIVLEDSASKASSEGESPSAKHPIIMHQLRPPFLGVHHMIIKRNFFYSRQGCKIGSHQAYSLYWIASIHELIVDNLSTYKEHIPCIIYATPNALKSCTM